MKRIPIEEAKLSFARSGGKGGQNVNKVETKVVLTWDLLASPCFSEEEKGRLAASPAIKRVLTGEGKIVLYAQEHRTQGQNREAVLKKFEALLKAALKPKKRRKKTAVPKSSKTKRRETKKHRAETKQERKKISV